MNLYSGKGTLLVLESMLKAKYYACFIHEETGSGVNKQMKNTKPLFFLLFFSPKPHKVAEVGFSPRYAWLQTYTASKKLTVVTQEALKDLKTLEIIEKV